MSDAVGELIAQAAKVLIFMTAVTFLLMMYKRTEKMYLQITEAAGNPYGIEMHENE